MATAAGELRLRRPERQHRLLVHSRLPACLHGEVGAVRTARGAALRDDGGKLLLLELIDPGVLGVAASIDLQPVES